MPPQPTQHRSAGRQPTLGTWGWKVWQRKSKQTQREKQPHKQHGPRPKVAHKSTLICADKHFDQVKAELRNIHKFPRPGILLPNKISNIVEERHIKSRICLVWIFDICNYGLGLTCAMFVFHCKQVAANLYSRPEVRSQNSISPPPGVPGVLRR